MPVKPRTIAPVRPNEGVKIAYRRRLEKLIAAMERSVLYWLGASYRANTPAMAQDATPAVELQRAVRRMTRQWQRRFNEGADELAAYFARETADRSDAALRAILKRSGIAVDFRMTAQARDLIQAAVAENVALIRSLPAQYMTQVEGHVMRAVQVGHDLSTLTKEITAQGGVTRRRAAFIARDQSAKATAAQVKMRQEEIGVTEAIWVHSGGGKTPRPSHVAFAAGRDGGNRYNVKEGALIDGKRIWPGTEINCRCVSRSVIPGF